MDGGPFSRRGYRLNFRTMGRSSFKGAQHECSQRLARAGLGTGGRIAKSMGLLWSIFVIVSQRGPPKIWTPSTGPVFRSGS
eukprot:9468735-Pyramimonas_sp.AAC.1